MFLVASCARRTLYCCVLPVWYLHSRSYRRYTRSSRKSVGSEVRAKMLSAMKGVRLIISLT